MPNLRLVNGSTTLLKVGSGLAIHDDCCCGEPVDPIYYCAACQDGILIGGQTNGPVEDYPDYVLDEITYTISGYQDVSEFLSPASVPTYVSSGSWKNLDLFNGTFVVPVYHSTSPLASGNTTGTLGTAYSRTQTGRSFVSPNPYVCGASRIMYPLADPCTFHGPSFPNWTVCPPNDFWPNTTAFNNCCCENEWVAWYSMTPCGTLTFHTTTAEGSNPSGGSGWLSLNPFNRVSYFNGTNRVTNWSGSLCSGSLTASFTMSLYNYDAFADDKCAWCVSTLPTPTIYTISITAVPTWVTPP